LGKANFGVAVIGLGKMGLVHSSVINVLPNVKLVALCEKSGLIRKFSQKLFKNVKIIDDFKKLIELNLDAVYITTPIPSHYAITKTIYSEGIVRNIFIEKTLAQKYEESEELCDLAKISGGANMVGYLRRFYVTFKKAKDLLFQDTIGSVSSFKAYSYSSDFFGMEKGKEVLVSRGGILRDLGCHAIDLALWFFGELKVESVELAPIINNNSENSLDFEAKNAIGIFGRFSISGTKRDYRMPEVGFSIIGSRGEIIVNDDRVELKTKNKKPIIWFRHDLNDNVPFWIGLPEYYREDAHFFNSIMNNCDAQPDFNTGAKVDDIISQVEKEAGEGY